MKLPTTTPARLRLYRKRAAESKYNPDWRGHRYARTWEPAWHNWNESRRKIYADARDTLGDYLGDWSEIMPRWSCRDANGFYADSYCYDVIKGGVERIRTAKGCLYVPVTYCTGWDGVTYYMDDAELVERGADESSHDKAKQIAASHAYNRAELEADYAREDHAKQRAEEDMAGARAEIHQINKEARALLAEIRGREFTDNVCAALRYRLQDYLADRRRLFKTIAEREDNYWSAVQY